MVSYLEIPTKKYGGELKFNDFLHYTGLRVMCWNLLKYSLRVWLGSAKRHDFEKIAHFAQMAWTLARDQGREHPYFKEDTEGDYLVVRKRDKQDFLEEDTEENGEVELDEPNPYEKMRKVG
jgi:hypothetical protein